MTTPDDVFLETAQGRSLHIVEDMQFQRWSWAIERVAWGGMVLVVLLALAGVFADGPLIVIDSLNGYQVAMPEEQSLILHMHELLQFLNRQGATTLLTMAQHGVVGEMKAPVDVTYLADTVLLLRYFEAFGRVRRAISVIKKRTGPHEDTIRELRIGKQGISVGEPLTDFQGILRGVPVLVGEGSLKLDASAG